MDRVRVECRVEPSLSRDCLLSKPGGRVGRRRTALRARPSSCKRSRRWSRSPRGRGGRQRRRCRTWARVQVRPRGGGTMFATSQRKREEDNHLEVLGVPADLQLVGRAESETDPRGKYSIKRFNGGAFAAVEVVWEKSGHGRDGNGCKAEGGAMLSMSSGVDFDARMAQGFFNACCLCCCAGESFFLSHFYLRDDVPAGTRADVLLAPPLPGDILMLRCEPGKPWLMQKGAFLACDFDVDIGVHTQGFRKGLFSGQGFFILKAQGTGLLLLASYGSIVKYELKEGEARKVDNGYLVAWPADMKYKIGKSSKSIRSSIFSGEGLACKFYGPGTLYIQTRALDSLARALTPLLSENSNAASDGI